jgi:hypothetical protein
MVFIERCVTSHDCNRSERPREMHTSFPRADSAQDQQAQYEIFSDVTRLADEIVKKEQSLL